MKKILNRLRCKLFGHNLKVLVRCPAGILVRHKYTSTLCNELSHCTRCDYNESRIAEGEDIIFYGDSVFTRVSSEKK